MLDAGTRAVEFVQGARLQNARHQVTDDFAIARLEQVHRPRGNRHQVRRSAARERFKLLDLVGSRFRVLDLGHQLRSSGHGVDRAITSGADLLAKLVGEAAARADIRR